MQERERGGGADQDAKGGAPPEQHALPAHDMQERGEVRRNPTEKGWGGHPPEQERKPFMYGLIQEMGGGP